MNELCWIATTSNGTWVAESYASVVENLQRAIEGGAPTFTVYRNVDGGRRAITLVTAHVVAVWA